MQCEFDQTTATFQSGVLFANDLFSNRALRAYFPGFGTPNTGLAGGAIDIVFLPASEKATIQENLADGVRTRVQGTQANPADPTITNVEVIAL